MTADVVTMIAIITGVMAAGVHFLRWRKQRGRFEGRMQLIKAGAAALMVGALVLYLEDVVQMGTGAGYILLAAICLVMLASAAESWVNL